MAFLDWKWGCNITFSKAKKVSGTTGFLDSQPCHFWRQHCYFWVFSRNPWSFWCSQGSRLSYKDVLDLQGKVMICHLKPAWLSFYCGTQTKIFWKCLVFLYVQWKWKGLDSFWTPLSIIVWTKTGVRGPSLCSICSLAGGDMRQEGLKRLFICSRSKYTGMCPFIP